MRQTYQPSDKTPSTFTHHSENEKETFESTSADESIELSPPVSSNNVSLDPANWIVNDKMIDFLLSKEIDENIDKKIL